MDPITLLGLIAGLLGTAATVITFILKRKTEKKEDQDALATVEADELRDGMDRVDALDADGLRRSQQDGPG